MFCKNPYDIYYFLYNVWLHAFLLELYGFAV